MRDAADECVCRAHGLGRSARSPQQSLHGLPADPVRHGVVMSPPTIGFGPAHLGTSRPNGRRVFDTLCLQRFGAWGQFTPCGGLAGDPTIFSLTLAQLCHHGICAPAIWRRGPHIRSCFGPMRGLGAARRRSFEEPVARPEVSRARRSVGAAALLGRPSGWRRPSGMRGVWERPKITCYAIRRAPPLPRCTRRTSVVSREVCAQKQSDTRRMRGDSDRRSASEGLSLGMVEGVVD